MELTLSEGPHGFDPHRSRGPCGLSDQLSPTLMSHQVITIRPDGSVTGLQVKRGKGLDLRSMGKARIRRVTLIEWDEDAQAWEVFRTPPLACHQRWGQEIAARLSIDTAKFNGLPCEYTDMLHFKEYEDAVAFEVAVIQSLMLRGEWTP